MRSLDSAHVLFVCSKTGVAGIVKAKMTKKREKNHRKGNRKEQGKALHFFAFFLVSAEPTSFGLVGDPPLAPWCRPAQVPPLAAAQPAEDRSEAHVRCDMM